MPPPPCCRHSRRRARVIPVRLRTSCLSALSRRSSAGGWEMHGWRVGESNRSSQGRFRVPEQPIISERVGLVLGSVYATPLEFWVGVEEGRRVQLDDAILVETQLPDGGHDQYFGVVDLVRKRYEGTQFDTDAFRAAAGTLPVEVSYAAHVKVTRVDPEVFVPPHPGDVARVAHGDDLLRALCFDRMERRGAVGGTRSGEPVYANLEFLDGTRGAHASISGVSGVATKTSYATFLLYSLFHSEALGADAVNSKALVFNVKGEDLLWLDRLNTCLDDAGRA